MKEEPSSPSPGRGEGIVDRLKLNYLATCAGVVLWDGAVNIWTGGVTGGVV
ncbi:MAG: hypothetical protein MUF69_13525 [Desulfobacterota bacterium]|nr:hypothetical protein [Thermodesulfobacteriota bacterium]